MVSSIHLCNLDSKIENDHRVFVSASQESSSDEVELGDGITLLPLNLEQIADVEGETEESAANPSNIIELHLVTDVPEDLVEVATEEITEQPLPKYFDETEATGTTEIGIIEDATEIIFPQDIELDAVTELNHLDQFLTFESFYKMQPGDEELIHPELSSDSIIQLSVKEPADPEIQHDTFNQLRKDLEYGQRLTDTELAILDKINAKKMKSSSTPVKMNKNDQSQFYKKRKWNQRFKKASLEVQHISCKFSQFNNYFFLNFRVKLKWQPN